MAKKGFYEELVTALKAGYTYSLTSNLPDPDPILAKIGQDVKAYEEVRSDPKVNACISQRKAGVLSLEWGLMPHTHEDEATNNASSEQALKVIEKALKDLNMPGLLSEVLDAFLWGFQPLEVVWEFREGFILPKKVQGKPPEWFIFDYSHNLKFKSVTNPLGEELPPRKFLLAQHHPTFKNPYGQKVLPLCFWPVTFKRAATKWWVTYVEKWGMPLLLGKYPRGLDEQARDNLMEMLEALCQDAVGTVPNDSQIETIQTGGSGGGSGLHKELLDQCNNEIALAIVGQTLTSEIGNSGSYAAAKTHNEVRADIVADDKRMVEAVLQKLVNWIYEVNWSEGEPPIFSLWAEEDIDKELAERDNILTNTGIKFNKAYYVQAYGLDENHFDIAPAQPDGQPAAAPGAAFAEFAANGQLVAPKVKIPINYELDGKKLTEFGKALIASAVNIARMPNSYEEAASLLAERYPQVDDTDLQDALARAFFIAGCEGRRDA